VVKTSASRVVLQRREYEPYGKQLTPALESGPGYTGHDTDPDTQYTYMQQRYYDPRVARFWSVDPVTVSNVGGNFNRYWYGNGNPYRFKDPDGRKIHAANRREERQIELLVNRLAQGEYRFNRNGDLQHVAASKQGSKYYSGRIDEAIASDGTITIDIGGEFSDRQGKKQLISGAGEGYNDPNRGLVTISGKSFGGLVDTSGRPLLDDPAHILMHELVGHAIPQLVGSDTGNAVENSNKVRLDLGEPLREPESWHGESF
jgi:RHS repeat-associated protein